MANLCHKLVKKLKPKPAVYEVSDDKLKGFLVRVQPSGSKSYYFSYRTTSGTRKRICIGNAHHLKYTDASRQALRYAAQVAQGEDPLAQQQAQKQEAREALCNTLEAFIDEEYAPWYLVHRKSGHRAIPELKRTFAFLLHTPMQDITALQVERWRTHKYKQGTTKNSLNRYLTALKGCLNKAVEWGYLEQHPLQLVKPYKVDRNKHIVRYLSDIEERNLRRALDEREQDLIAERDRYNQWREERHYALYPDLKTLAFADYLKPLIILAMNTGLRRGELLSLCWSQINVENRLLTVHGDKAKSGQTRHVPLNTEALTTLQRWQQQQATMYSKPLQTDVVFPNSQGEAMTDIKKSWAVVLKRAKIQQFRFHDLRHHFASQLVMHGVDLNTIRELLGHRDYSTTLRYAHLAPGILSEAVAKLKPRTWEDTTSISAIHR